MHRFRAENQPQTFDLPWVATCFTDSVEAPRDQAVSGLPESFVFFNFASSLIPALEPQARAGQMSARLAAVLFEAAPRLGRRAAPMPGPAAGARTRDLTSATRAEGLKPCACAPGAQASPEPFRQMACGCLLEPAHLASSRSSIPRSHRQMLRLPGSVSLRFAESSPTSLAAFRRTGQERYAPAKVGELLNSAARCDVGVHRAVVTTLAFYRWRCWSRGQERVVEARARIVPGQPWRLVLASSR